MMDLPKLIGHRGLAGVAPENTLPAFEAARAHQLQWVELDAKLCGSGELVVFHDNTLNRTTNGTGRVSEHSYATLKQLDAGAWFNDAFKGTRIPLLAEVLDYLASQHMAVNIELKPNRGDYKQTATAVATLLKTLPSAKRLPILISSFSLQSLRAARDCMPDIPRGLLLEHKKSFSEILTLIHETKSICFNYDNALINPELVRKLNAQNIPTLVWTVNDVERAKALFALGVSGVFSDHPLPI